MLKHWFLFAMAGLSGLLYGIDIGVIAAALPYLKAATAFTDAQLSLIVGAVVMGAVVSALFAGVFLTFAVSAVAYFIVVKCFLPETKGKSLAEIEGLFNRETKWS